MVCDLRRAGPRTGRLSSLTCAVQLASPGLSKALTALLGCAFPGCGDCDGANAVWSNRVEVNKVVRRAAGGAVRAWRASLSSAKVESC